MWMGDLNTARHNKDVFDGAYNEERKQWPGFLDWERKTMDRTLRDSQLVDVFENFYSHLQGKDRYTFYRRPKDKVKQLGWRLDYVCADTSMLNQHATEPYVESIQVLDQYLMV